MWLIKTSSQIIMISTKLQFLRKKALINKRERQVIDYLVKLVNIVSI